MYSGFVWHLLFDASQVLIFGSLLISYRSEPLLQLPEEWVFPCGYVLAFPTGIPGRLMIMFQYTSDFYDCNYDYLLPLW